MCSTGSEIPHQGYNFVRFCKISCLFCHGRVRILFCAFCETDCLVWCVYACFSFLCFYRLSNSYFTVSQAMVARAPPPPVHAFTVFARWVSILTARRLSLNVACVSVCVCALFCKTKYSVRVCAFLCIYCILCSGIEKVRCARRLSKTLCRCVDDCLRSCMRAGTLGLWKRIVGTT